MEPADNILAFRTIMTMLNVLQDGPTSHRPDPYLRNSSSTGISKTQDIRILNAIATLLVRHNEVTAVGSVAKRGACPTVAVCNQSIWFDGDTDIA